MIKRLYAGQRWVIKRVSVTDAYSKAVSWKRSTNMGQSNNDYLATRKFCASHRYVLAGNTIKALSSMANENGRGLHHVT